MLVDTDRAKWMASLMEEITLSDDERDLMIEIARRELVRAHSGAIPKARIDDLVLLLDDLAGDAIITIRRPDPAQMHG